LRKLVGGEKGGRGHPSPKKKDLSQGGDEKEKEEGKLKKTKRRRKGEEPFYGYLSMVLRRKTWRRVAGQTEDNEEKKQRGYQGMLCAQAKKLKSLNGGGCIDKGREEVG